MNTLETILIVYLSGYALTVLILLWRHAKIARTYRTWPVRYDRLDQRAILQLAFLSWLFALIFIAALVMNYFAEDHRRVW